MQHLDVTSAFPYSQRMREANSQHRNGDSMVEIDSHHLVCKSHTHSKFCTVHKSTNSQLQNNFLCNHTRNPRYENPVTHQKGVPWLIMLTVHPPTDPSMKPIKKYTHMLQKILASRQ